MTVKLTPRRVEHPYFNVLMRRSEVSIADDAREVNDWIGELSSTGIYAIREYMAKAGSLAGRTANCQSN